MNDSILISVKEKIGIDAEDTAFDSSIIDCINSAFFVLNQLGVGPSTPFIISSSSAKWDDFIQNDPFIESVKIYVYAKARKIFDPPASSTIMEALNSV